MLTKKEEAVLKGIAADKSEVIIAHEMGLQVSQIRRIKRKLIIKGVLKKGRR